MPEPTKILYVGASVDPARPLSTGEEFNELQAACDTAPTIELRPLFRATAEKLHQELIRFKPSIVHVVAHGSSAGLELHHARDPEYDRTIGADHLAKLLGRRDGLRCVVFNTCHSLEWISAKNGRGRWRPTMIVMNSGLGDVAGVAFSKGFYTNLAAGENVARAYEEGVKAAALAAPHAPFEPSLFPDCRGIIGIRSKVDFHAGLFDRCEYYCDLEAALASGWEEAAGAIRALLEKPELQADLADGEAQLLVHLDCPFSISMLLGRLLGRARVFPFHRRGKHRTVWKPDTSLPPPQTPGWVRSEGEGTPDADTLVVSLSVTRDTREAVARTLAQRDAPSYWIDFRPRSGFYDESIAGAQDAWGWAQTLAAEIHREQGKTGAKQVELFISAPNPLVFFLGQQGANLGRLRMNEFDKTEQRYFHSFDIPAE